MSVLPEYTRLLPWGVILLTASFCRCDESSSQPSADGDLFVDVFGESSGKPIDAGLLFINGRYVEAPYTFTRRGTSVYVNGILVRRYGVTWPPKKFEVDEDPGTMPNVTKNSTFEEGHPPDAHWRRKLCYLYQHLPPQEARRRMIEYFEQLPFVRSVKVLDHIRIVVEMHSGETQQFGWLEDFGSRLRTPTRKEILDWLEAKREQLERYPKRNSCALWYESGPQTSFSFRKAVEILPNLLSVLGSHDKSDEYKLFVLDLYGIIPAGHRKKCRLWVNNFQPSKQLNERLAEFRKKSGRLPPILSEAEHDAIVRQVMNSDKPLKEKRNEFAELLREKQRALQKEASDYRTPPSE